MRQVPSLSSPQAQVQVRSPDIGVEVNVAFFTFFTAHERFKVTEEEEDM